MATYKIDGDLNVTGSIYKDGVLDVPCEEITYSALKAKRDAGELVPGRQYRITDYQCTTVTANTSSAGHQFDIIVVADSASVLNENARACLHSGDTYFASNNLQAWKLWYSIDNDTNKFAWADSTNGKGVIYRMVDEFGNDVPYDFKNILVTRSGRYTNAYTFSYTEDSVIKDASLVGYAKGCYANKMDQAYYTTSLKVILNRIVFYSSNTTFNCYANTFGANCYVISFGSGCNNNMFGSGCNNNIFGNNCYENTFGANCSSNTFGPNCNGNTCAAYFFSNTLGSSCTKNTFGAYCSLNTFGATCVKNTLGPNCTDNTFGSHCDEITFGATCSYITFGSSASSTIDYCRDIVVDNGCTCLNINGNGTASSSNRLQYIHVHVGVKGPSNVNRLTITVPDRNLPYETSYEMTGSTTVTL